MRSMQHPPAGFRVRPRSVARSCVGFVRSWHWRACLLVVVALSAARGDRVQSRRAADPLGSLLSMPWARCREPAGRIEIGYRSGRPGRLGRTSSRCAGRCESQRTGAAHQDGRRRPAHAAGRFGPAALAGTNRNARAVDRRGRQVAVALVVHSAVRPELPKVQHAEWPRKRNRRLHSGPARKRRPDAVARGRQDDAAAARHARPDRPAADASRS